MKGAGVTNIKTRVSRPQSNGLVARVRRTHREEELDEASNDHYQAIKWMIDWSRYYNHERPHSALKYLCPIDYYRGDPEARLAERQQKLKMALKAREAYWASSSRC